MYTELYWYNNYYLAVAYNVMSLVMNMRAAQYNIIIYYYHRAQRTTKNIIYDDIIDDHGALPPSI